MSITVTRPEKVVPFCTNLGLASAHEAAVLGLREAQKAAQADPRENGSPEVRAAAERVRAIEAEMREHTALFTIRGLRRKVWVEFCESHPPRKDNEGDKRVGIDVSALDAVIPESIVSVKDGNGRDVEIDVASEWVGLADEMTNGQWSDFAQAVIDVNHEVRAAPFSQVASAVIRRSGATSTEPPS